MYLSLNCASYGQKVADTHNLATLSELTTDKIIKILKTRYLEHVIYTNIGDILIALNPFQHLDIYSPKFQSVYGFYEKPNPQPHIFATAQRAFKNLVHTSHNQCCVISGESGAGKTETAKYFVRHVLAVAKEGTSAGNQKGSVGVVLEQNILAINPILEAFGNAKTSMNNNSSRFGKYAPGGKRLDGMRVRASGLTADLFHGCARYLELIFDEQLRIRGAKITEYLLEKSRVVAQGREERNFHVFYLLISGNDSLTDRERLQLTQAEDYVFLGGTAREDELDHNLDLLEPTQPAPGPSAPQKKRWAKDRVIKTGKGLSGSQQLRNLEFREAASKTPGHAKGTRAAAGPFEQMDKEEARVGYKVLQDALKQIGFLAAETSNLNTCLAIILHLGNIQFHQPDDSDVASVARVSPLLAAAQLLGCKAVDLADCFRTSINVVRGETIVKTHTLVQAVDACNATAKALYGRLFTWLVARINDFLQVFASL